MMPEFFSLYEIEHCISRFTGDDETDVNIFVREFEEVAEICGWSEIRKYVYARKFVGGTAAALLRVAKTKTWNEVRDELVAEFSPIIFKSAVHKELRSRKIRNGESMQQYCVSMRTIAAKANVEEADVVRYIVEGIARDNTQLMFFAHASTYAEMRILLAKYRHYCGDRYVTDPEHSNHTTRKWRSRCYYCKELGHLVSRCWQKNRDRNQLEANKIAVQGDLNNRSTHVFNCTSISESDSNTPTHKSTEPWHPYSVTSGDLNSSFSRSSKLHAITIKSNIDSALEGTEVSEPCRIYRMTQLADAKCMNYHAMDPFTSNINKRLGMPIASNNRNDHFRQRG